MTNWSVGGSHKESSLLPIDRLGVKYDSQLQSYALFFIAIRIRINVAALNFKVAVPCNGDK